MARLVDNLAQYLENGGIGTQATDLFIGVLPASPDNAIMIDQTGGVEPNKYIPVKEPTIQVLVRNTSYPDGLDKITAIYDLLHRFKDYQSLETGGVDVMQIMALQEPTHLQQDDNNRHIFTVNFVVMLRGS